MQRKKIGVLQLFVTLGLCGLTGIFGMAFGSYLQSSSSPPADNFLCAGVEFGGSPIKNTQVFLPRGFAQAPCVEAMAKKIRKNAP